MSRPEPAQIGVSCASMSGAGAFAARHGINLQPNAVRELTRLAGEKLAAGAC